EGDFDVAVGVGDRDVAGHAVVGRADALGEGAGLGEVFGSQFDNDRWDEFSLDDLLDHVRGAGDVDVGEGGAGCDAVAVALKLDGRQEDLHRDRKRVQARFANVD